MGNACRPCKKIFCTESGRMKKNEEASCESAGGNLFQIHCTSGIVWYCGVGKLQLLYFGIHARAAQVIYQDKSLEKLNWLPISYI